MQRELLQATLPPLPPYGGSGMCPRLLTDVKFTLRVLDGAYDRSVDEIEIAQRPDLAPDPARPVHGSIALIGSDDTLLGGSDVVDLPAFAGNLRRALDQLTTFGAPGRVSIPGQSFAVHMELLADLTVLSLVRSAGRPYARRAYLTSVLNESLSDAITRLELCLRTRGLLVAANVIRGETTTPRRQSGLHKRVQV